MVRITADSLLFVELDEETGVETSIDILKTENGLVSYLDQYVAIDEGVLVGQVISILSQAQEEIDYVFDASLNGQSIETYLAELEDVSTYDGSLAFTEIVHDVELGSDGVLSELKYFRGVGPVPATGRLGDFSLEMLPLSFYKDLPLMLNHNYVVERIEVVNGAAMSIVELKAKKGFTLYEVIYAIFYEISFHGTPSERKELLDEILAICAQAMNESMSETNLPAAASAGRDVELARLRTEMETALGEENYEKAAELRDRIRELNGDR